MVGAGAIEFELIGEDPASYAFSLLVRYEDGTTQQIDPHNDTVELIVRTAKFAQKNNIQLQKWDKGLIINGTKYEAKINNATRDIREVAKHYEIDSSLPLSAVSFNNGSIIFVGARDLYQYMSLRRA